MTTLPPKPSWFSHRSWTRLLPELVTLTLCVLMLRLGSWQHHKAEIKIERQSSYTEYAREPICIGESCLPVLGERPAYGRRVQIDGLRWSNQHCLLDNQVVEGRAGYLVMTALQAPPAVVLRGWLPLTSRTEQPQLDTEGLPKTLFAQIAYPPATGVAFGMRAIDPEPMGQDVLRVQYLDANSVRACFGVDEISYVLRETAAQTDGLTRAWAAPGSGAERHQAYAVQWWAMTAVLIMVHIGFRISTAGKRP